MNRKPRSRYSPTLRAFRSRISRGLAVGFGGGHDAAERVDERRVVELAGNAHAVRQVRRADEQHVDALDRRDLVGVVDGCGDSIWMTPITRWLSALIELWPTSPSSAPRVSRARPRAPSGGQRRKRHRLSGLFGGVDPGNHDPVGSEVERTADAQALAGGRTDDRGGLGGADRVEVLQQVGLAGSRRARDR